MINNPASAVKLYNAFYECLDSLMRSHAGMPDSCLFDVDGVVCFNYEHVYIVSQYAENSKYDVPCRMKFDRKEVRI